MKMRTLILLAALTGLAAAGQDQSGATAPTEIDKLKAKAESMKEHDRGKIYSEIARDLTEQTNREFDEGHPEAASESLKQVLEYAEKASASAKLKNKKTKDTEINLRQIARRLEEIERSLAVEDRPPLTAAVEKVDAIRKDLLEFFLKRG
ncbi:MAG TPA: hypothetical protein VMZ25_03805 [Terriglobales bacterium]|nr:hypothetical protein [Terriglobales bacterium]